MFINTYLVVIGILLVIPLIIYFLLKSEETLPKAFILICSISMILMFVFLGIKLTLDITYTKDKFEQFYTEQNEKETSNNKSKIDIGITGIKIKTQKEFYLDECMKLYGIFRIKTDGLLGVHFLLNILLICEIVRILKRKEKKDKIRKDDLILFDEEQNVKI